MVTIYSINTKSLKLKYMQNDPIKEFTRVLFWTSLILIALAFTFIILFKH